MKGQIKMAKKSSKKTYLEGSPRHNKTKLMSKKQHTKAHKKQFGKKGRR